MGLQAGFAEVEITPPAGTRKLGWIRNIIGTRVLDPLFARAAILESGGQSIAFLQLDTLSIREEEVGEIRRQVAERYGFAGDRLLVAATHNHAGPAIASLGDVRIEQAYVDALVTHCVSVFGQALEQRVEAELGIGRAVEFNVAFNRRTVMRNGTVRTHANFDDPEALYTEGPIDPEVVVIAARKKNGTLLGALVNFACHPAHHGPDEVFSAGFPGVLARELKLQGCPLSLFLNGAQGNLVTSNPAQKGADLSMEQAGERLAQAASRALTGMAYRSEVKLEARSRTVSLPFRTITEDEIRGTVRGAQRFVDPSAYEREMPALVEKIKKLRCQTAELQVFFLDQHAVVALPAECFVELGLRIKERAHPLRAVVVGLANGMVGYVPHPEAFSRGGYETTFCGWSNLAPEAGTILVEAALELISSVAAHTS